MKKIVTIVGARPQFVKMAPLSIQLRKHFHEIVIHTGQHYDYLMSKVFFEDLRIPQPDYDLDVGSGFHAEQTARMLIGIEKVLIDERPLLVIVYGDTNSTLAGALAAAKLNIPVAHVEAGLRSYNRAMPEEVNRVLTDHLSAILFCPTQRSVSNLKKEGITSGVYRVGDVMYDTLLMALGIMRAHSALGVPDILKRTRLEPGQYAFVTIHRAENTDNPFHLKSIVAALKEVPLDLLFPLHPRTRKMLKSHELIKELAVVPRIRLIEPVRYLESLILTSHARIVLTDSGGLQKEAFLLGTPCVTLREETEWPETVEAGANHLSGVNTEAILSAVHQVLVTDCVSWDPSVFGDGHACERIVDVLLHYSRSGPQ